MQIKLEQKVTILYCTVRITQGQGGLLAKAEKLNHSINNSGHSGLTVTSKFTGTNAYLEKLRPLCGPTSFVK